METRAEPEPQPPSLADLALRYWLLLAGIGGLLLSPLTYALLATLLPAGALFASSLSLLAGMTFLVLHGWHPGRKITWQRRLEVYGYRVGGALAGYLVLGYGVLFLLDAVSPSQFPLGWPAVASRLAFWPFYLYFVLGCDVGLLPCPPPPG